MIARKPSAMTNMPMSWHLAHLGYLLVPANNFGSKHLVRGGEVEFTGTAWETFLALRAGDL